MRLITAATALCGLLSSSLLCAAESNITTSPVARLVLPKDFTPPQVFKNTNLLRNINLEKGYLRETVNVVVENVDKKPQSDYYIPFSADIIDKVGGLEVRDKKAPEKGRFDIDVTTHDGRYVSCMAARLYYLSTIVIRVNATVARFNCAKNN